MLGILSTSTSRNFGIQSSMDTKSKLSIFMLSFLLGKSEETSKNLSLHCAKPLADTEMREFASSILMSSPNSSIFLIEDTAINYREAHSQATKQALEEVLGPYTVEISDKRTEILPPNSVEVHTERISKTAFRLTARSHDSEQNMISIVFDLIRLGIKHEESDRAFRNLQQQFMVMHMEKVVENLMNQSKMILYACIASGVLGIVGGLLPIIGLMKGDKILKWLGKWFSSLKNAKQEKVFMPLSRSLDAASRTTEMGNRSQTTQAESLKTHEESRSKVFDIGQQESTRTLDEKNRRRDTYIAMIDKIIERWYQFFQSLCR